MRRTFTILYLLFGIKKRGIFYETLDKGRQNIFEKQYEEAKLFVIEAKKRHLVAMQLADALFQDDEASVFEILCNENEGIIRQ